VEESGVSDKKLLVARVLATNHEQWQCQGRRDLEREKRERAPLIDWDD